MSLENKVAVVTGGGAGIGRGVAERFLAEGARVALWEIDADRAKQTEQDLGANGRLRAVVTDVGKAEQVRNAFARTIEAFGQVDILVNNAGISRAAPFVELTEAAWDAVLECNLKAAFLCAQIVARHLIERGQPGRILNITSVDAEMAYPFNVHYCASKAGLQMFTKSTALALAPHNITVNDIAPGLILSEMTRRAYQSPDAAPMLAAKVPMNKLGMPADIASLAAYLASDEAHYITGTTVTVDGAHSLGAPFYVYEQFRAR